MADTYEGWTNYETWAVKLWIDNEEGSYTYWRQQTRDAWDNSGVRRPNQFVDDHMRNAQIILAEQLKAEHDSNSDHPVFAAADGTVYADLLNAALSSVNWHEIAQSMLQDADLEPDNDETETEPAKQPIE